MRGKVYPVSFYAQRRSFGWMNNDPRGTKHALYATGMSHSKDSIYQKIIPGQKREIGVYQCCCVACNRSLENIQHQHGTCLIRLINGYIGLFVSPAIASRCERTMIRSRWHSVRRCDSRTAERGSYVTPLGKESRIKHDATL